MKTLLILLGLLSATCCATARANVIDNWTIIDGTPNANCNFACGNLTGTFSYDVTAGEFVTYNITDDIYNFNPGNSTCSTAQCDKIMVAYNSLTNTTIDINSPEFLESTGGGPNAYWGWVVNGPYPTYTTIDTYRTKNFYGGQMVIQLTSVDVPEPGSLMLLALGLAALLINRRRSSDLN